MIEQLLKVIQENSQDAVVKNKNIPDSLNTNVQMELMNSIESSLASSLSAGNTQQVIELFGKSAKNQNIAGNPMVQGIIKNAVTNISKKYNLPPALVTTIASSLIPQVLGKFAKQTADPKNPAIDMNQIVGVLLGGKKPQGVDFNDMLEQFTKARSGQKTTGTTSAKTTSKTTTTKTTKTAAKTNTQQQDPIGNILGTLGKLLGK